VRLLSLVFGLWLFALAIVLTFVSHLGLWPWDVLHQGIAKHTPLTFGVTNVVVGLFVLVVAWMLGGTPGIGTVANAVLVGLFIQGMLSLGVITGLAHHGLALRIPLLAIGIALAAPGTAFYIGANLGAGPRDTLMLVGSQRTGVRVGGVRAAIELTALAIGIALGGTFGFGTVAFALAVGPAVEIGFWSLVRLGLADEQPGTPPVVIGE
jgi:uncharacterized membrane protein YczE